MFVIPTGPGRSRVLWWLIVHAEGLPAPFRLLAGLKPRWVDHLTRNLVFDGDNIILHMQVCALPLPLAALACVSAVLSALGKLSCLSVCLSSDAGACRSGLWQRTAEKEALGSGPTTCPPRQTGALVISLSNVWPPLKMPVSLKAFLPPKALVIPEALSCMPQDALGAQ